MKIRPVGAELFHAEGHDKSNNLFFDFFSKEPKSKQRFVFDRASSM
jgi:hypothetical protein